MTEASRFWSKLNAERATRRSVLRSSAALGVTVASLSLTGCGSNSDRKSTAREDTNKLAYTPSDTTAKAVKGGTRADEWQMGSTFQNFDPFNTGFIQSLHSYSRLLLPEIYKYPAPVQYAVRPDTALSWEVAPDGLQYTYKLRPNMKFDPRPPTNGRVMTSQDVKLSWDAWAAKSTVRTILSNAASKTAPVVSMTASDAQTLVVKTAFPYAPTNLLFASDRYFQILPAEGVDGKFDTRSEMRGSGTWRLKNYVASQRVEYEKNPDWYDAAKVNYDGLTHFLITEPATGLAQFRSGALWTYDVKQEDVLSTKKSLPRLNLRAQEQFSTSADYIRFSYLPGSPFRDERVRKAASMLIDRDLFIETFRNSKELTDAGLKVGSRWNTAVPAGWDGFWLDPKDTKAFGDASKFFKFDPAEAKKLMQAAGYNSALATKYSYSPSVVAAAQAEAYKGMWEANGDFKLQTQALDYVSDFRPNYAEGGDKHEGIIYNVAAAVPDLDVWFESFYRSGQPRSGHLDANGAADAAFDAMLDKQRIEQDMGKRTALIQDIQKYAASKMYLLHNPGGSLGFDLAWPWLANWNTYRSISSGAGAVNEARIFEWYDASKKTS